MVIVQIFKGDNYIKGLEIKGHADFDVIGKDIVCSAISAVSIGGLNNLENITDFDVKIEKGYIYCLAKNSINSHDQIVLQTIICQLYTIEKQFPCNLKLKERN